MEEDGAVVIRLWGHLTITGGMQERGVVCATRLCSARFYISPFKDPQESFCHISRRVESFRWGLDRGVILSTLGDRYTWENLALIIKLILRF